jgi:hypothetical protein
MRIRATALTILLAVAAVAVADTPTDQPDVIPGDDNGGDRAAQSDGNNGPGGNRPGQRFRRFMDGMRGMRNGQGPGMGSGNGGLMGESMQDGPASDEEWKQISTFCAENFPNRWKLFERVRDARGDDAPLVQSIKQRFTVRYRQLMRAQMQPDDTLYQAALDQGKLEDSCWGFSQQLQTNPDDAHLQQQLHDAVATLVKNQMAERERRLKAAKEALDDAQASYDNDNQRINELINMRVERLSRTSGDVNSLLPATAPDSAPTTAPADRQ